MHEYDRRLHNAIEKYQAEDKRYDARVCGAGIQIIEEFLRPLEMRTEGWTVSRQKFIQEATEAIRSFDETRTSLRIAVAHLKFATAQLGNAVYIRAMEKLQGTGNAPSPDLPPLELVKACLEGLGKSRLLAEAEIEARREVLRNAVDICESSIQCATVIILVRREELEHFRSNHLLSPYRQMIEQIGVSVDDQLRDYLLEQSAKRLLDYLADHGLVVAAEVALPGVKLGIAVVKAFYACSRPPESYKNSGAGDDLMKFRDSLVQENESNKRFVKDLNDSFEKFNWLHNQILNVE